MNETAILTLLDNEQEVLKVTLDKLMVRSCEFTCSLDQTCLLREQGGNSGRFRKFDVRLRVNPSSGPSPQYVDAKGQVTSLRRNSQDSFGVIVSFESCSNEGYRLIGDHLSNANRAEESVTPVEANEQDSKVIELDSVKANYA